MNTYIISVSEDVVSMYEVYGKDEKEAEEYFYAHLAQLQSRPIGFQKEIKSIIHIEKRQK